MSFYSKLWCKLFGCQEFVDLKADLAQVRADLATVVIAVTGIAGQFPITVPAPDLGNVPRDVKVLTFPDMQVWAELPVSAVQNDVVDIEVWAKGTAGSNIEAFGLGPAGFVFDPAQFTYTGIVRGAEVIPWNSVDANEVNPGQLTIGGFAGGARGIIGDKPAHLFTIKLTVNTPNTVVGTITLDNYVDDIIDFTPKPLTLSVSLN